MGHLTLPLKLNSVATNLTTSKAAPKGRLVAACVFIDEALVSLTINWCELGIALEDEAAPHRQVSLNSGYLSSQDPLRWHGNIKLEGNELLRLSGRSQGGTLVRAVFTVEEDT